MALRIKKNKVVDIPTPKLSKKQAEKMEKATPNEKIIKRATSRKYNIVYI